MRGRETAAAVFALAGALGCGSGEPAEIGPSPERDAARDTGRDVVEADTPAVVPGQPCSFGAECPAPLVCKKGACDYDCRTDADCLSDQSCVLPDFVCGHRPDAGGD